MWKSKYFSAKNQWFLVYHIYCIFLFTLKFGLNCINVVFFKFVFCFHNFIIFVVSCVVWNDKNWTKSNHVTALSFYLSETKISAKLTFFNLYYQLAKFYRPRWYFNFFIISLVCVCNAISHDLDARWRQKLHCYNDLQSYFSKQLSLIVRCTWQAAQIKKVTLYVSVQLWSKSCLCFWTFP